jgi:hypothetical protein
MADWMVVERRHPHDARWLIWLDEDDGERPAANAMVIGMGATREAAWRSALAELQAHVVTVSLRLAGVAEETPHGAH